jgi:hypothetical protein
MRQMMVMANPTAFSEDTRECVRRQIRREEGEARFPLGLFLILLLAAMAGIAGVSSLFIH